MAPPGIKDGGVFNLWTGDCNGDDVVNNDDSVYAFSLYGALMNDSKYNPACDLNIDGCVDIFDLMMLTYNFGCSSGDYAGAGGVAITYPPKITDVLLFLSEGDEYIVPLSAMNVATFNGMTITVTYDPTMLQLLNIAEQAYGTHVSGGAIAGTGITVMSVSPGSVALNFNVAIQPGKTWSGAITALKFKAIGNGLATVRVG